GGGGLTTGSPFSRTLLGGIGVASGLAFGGAGACSCNRSFASPFTLFFFFLAAVSPLSPSGADCTCCAAFSSAAIGVGAAAAFSFTFAAFAASLLALSSIGARSLYLVFFRSAAAGASGSSFAATSPVCAIGAIADPGAGSTLGAPPSTWSAPEAIVSSGEAGSEFRGACPKRIFSRRIFLGFLPAATVWVFAPAEFAAGVAVGPAAPGFAPLAAAETAAPAVKPAAPAVDPAAAWPRSSRDFSPRFFFTAGGAYDANTGLVCF